MPQKKPNLIDVHVGSRVRLRRTMRGMSQEKLGEALGITFQQIQKYEKGTNRIGASRMQQIADALEVPVSFFFEDVPAPTGTAPGAKQEAGETSYVIDFLSTPEGIQLNRAFAQIRDAAVRRKIVELVRAFADAQNDSA